MTRYLVSVHVQYDEEVYVQADSPEEARLTAEQEVRRNVNYYDGFIDVNPSEAEEA